MYERIPDSHYQQLHHFIGESDWDALGVMRTVARQTQPSLQSEAGQQGLLLDESGWEKAGRLYLPTECTDRPDRCRAVGIPIH